LATVPSTNAMLDAMIAAASTQRRAGRGQITVGGAARATATASASMRSVGVVVNGPPRKR
jgi:hypothetical protein